MLIILKMKMKLNKLNKQVWYMNLFVKHLKKDYQLKVVHNLLQVKTDL